MAIVETNWQRFLSSESGLPPDVFFVVKEEGQQDEVEEKEVPNEVNQSWLIFDGWQARISI